jgi:thiamine biosynthesis protein ThiC
MKDVKDGVIANKIAAYAADLAKPETPMRVKQPLDKSRLGSAYTHHDVKRT